jgi:Ca-activated chloride channel homolog
MTLSMYFAQRARFFQILVCSVSAAAVLAACTTTSEPGAVTNAPQNPQPEAVAQDAVAKATKPPPPPMPTPAAPRAAAVPPAPSPAPAPASVAAGVYAVPIAPNPVPRMMAPPLMPAPQHPAAANTAQYQQFADTPWRRVAEVPVSTFSADVDTGSYANVRRFINRGQLPPKDAVRVEELVNYFGYSYALPPANHPHPFVVHTQVVASPWNAQRAIVRIGIQGKDAAKATLPAANLVFLVDVSGSMGPQDRLPLVKASLKLLTTQLRSQDRVSLVSYASGTRLVLPPTPGDQQSTINAAIDTLVAYGGTYGETGIRMAYTQAKQSFIKGGINRVLLATDGDMNIGVTSRDELKALVEGERKQGVSLTTLGVGDSNFNEALMKTMADVGDGSYHYLDSLQEAHKVLVNQFTSNLAPIAQDLKIQVEFNPAHVQEYRLLGYELRALTREQFNDDKVDAGDIGAGHSVTALYEIVPSGARGNVDALRYQAPAAGAQSGSANSELAWVKLRYKDPGHTTSKLIEQPIANASRMPSLDSADTDARFALAVAAWGQWLRGNTLIGDYNTDKVLTLARSARGTDNYGHRAEFLRLVELSATLKR